jgi:hypothetical protein
VNFPPQLEELAKIQEEYRKQLKKIADLMDEIIKNQNQK